MRSKKKTLLILLIAVVLMASVLVLTISFLRAREENKGPAQRLSHDVLQVDIAQVKSMDVHGPGAEPYRLELNGSYNGTLEGVPADVELDTMMLSLFISKFTSIRSYHDPLMLNSGNTLADYGLETPCGYVVVENMDGSSYKVLVGNQTVKKNGYYLHVEGSDAVYVVENTYFEYLQYTTEDYIDKQLASVDQDNGFTITQLSIQNLERDYQAITIRMRFGQYEDNSIYLYEVVEPEYHSGDDYKITENVFAYLNPLKGKAVYSLDTSEQNLTALGLMEPQYVLRFIHEGVEREFLFTQLETGEVLGMKNGGGVILEMDPGILHMLNIRVADVSNAYVLLQSISEIEHYIVTANGTEYDFTVSSAEGELTGASYLGRELAAEAFRELYSRGLDIKITGDMDDTQAYGRHILNITYQTANGEKQSVDYYEFDGRYCCVTLNGTGRFLARLSDLEAFTEYLEVLANGGSKTVLKGATA